jgi:hypothetical protein
MRIPITDELATETQSLIDDSSYPDATSVWREAFRLLHEKHGWKNVDTSGIVVNFDDMAETGE